MILTAEDKASGLWSRLSKHLDAELAKMRALNDGDKNEVDTAHLRGRIAQIKAIQSLAKDLPVFEE